MSEAKSISEPVTELHSRATRRALLVGLLLAVTLHAFAELAVVTVLPIISRDLDGALLYGVAFSAYLITSLVSIVWSGHMTDERGPVFPFSAGLVVFAIGLIWAGLATDMWMMVVARAVQGLGGGAFSAVIYASVNRGWEDKERAHIMALLSSAWVIPGLVAPAAAGAIAEFWNWRLVFFGLLPFVPVTLALSLKGMRAQGSGEVTSTATAKIIDACRIALGISIFLAGITRDPDLWSLALVIGGILLSAAPVYRVLPPGEGRSRQILLASLGVKFLLVFGFFGADTFLPLALIEIHGLTAFMAGIVLTTASLAWSGAAFMQSHLSSRVSPRALAVTGMAIIGVSVLALLLLVMGSVPYWFSFILWGIAGGGTGLVYNTVITSAMAHTVKGKEGATSVANGLVEGSSIALVAGLGGAILNQADRAGAPLNIGIGIIWTICAITVFIGAAVCYRYLETKVRVEIITDDEDAPVEAAQPSLAEDLSQD